MIGKRILVSAAAVLTLLAATILDLGALPGDTASAAYAANATGQAVGVSSPPVAEGEAASGRAFLHDGALASPHEAIIPGASAGSSSFAYGINNAGLLVGWAKVASESPSPSPVATPAAEEEGASSPEGVPTPPGPPPR